MSKHSKTRGATGQTYREVVELVNAGWSRPEIATELDVTTTTVGYHKRKARERGDLVVRRLLPEPAPVSQPPLVIRIPVGVSVQVVREGSQVPLTAITA